MKPATTRKEDAPRSGFVKWWNPLQRRKDSMVENKRTSRVEIVLGDLEEEQFDLFDGLSHDQARKLARHMQEVGENWIRTEPLAGDEHFVVQLTVNYGGYRHVRGEYWFEDYEKAQRLAEAAKKHMDENNIYEPRATFVWYRVDWARRGAAAEQMHLPYVLKLVLDDGNTTLASARFAADDASIHRAVESVQDWLHDTPGLELAGADARQNIDEFLVFMDTNDPEGSLD